MCISFETLLVISILLKGPIPLITANMPEEKKLKVDEETQ